MIITKKIKEKWTSSENRKLVWVDFEWFETNKRIQHKIARDGKTLRLKFLKENPDLQQEDILYQEQQIDYLVNIKPCDCLVIKPRSTFETASICYEIGNKHLPLFYEENILLVSFEKPLFMQLQAMGFVVSKEVRRLSNSLKTTVTAHGGNKSLFSKIMDLTEKK
ncbi:urease accessory protein UreE [uncultured Zobellia sp.]|uniref:urease accessory protein UreE n=1 Tax=uncultured Zobellia sp. TaxID=255433 RepID=UPI0025995595|nr:urease accessory protein UreE [uncultured Zobellia sp.]